MSDKELDDIQLIELCDARALQVMVNSLISFIDDEAMTALGESFCELPLIRHELDNLSIKLYKYVHYYEV
jgi:hypothetical protein